MLKSKHFLRPLFGMILTILLPYTAYAGGWENSELELARERNKMSPWTSMTSLCEAVKEQALTMAMDRKLSQKPVTLGLSSQAFGKALPTISTVDSLSGLITWASNDMRPLVAILPGIFQDSEHFLPRFFARKLNESGYHVIVLPSPFSKPYLDRLPRAAVGSFEREAEIYLDALKHLRSNYSKRVGSISVIGLSYGASIGSVMTAIDQDNIVDGGLTLFGPTFKMATTQRLIDEMIDRGNSSPFWSLCNYAAGTQTLPDIQTYTQALLAQFQFYSRPENQSLRGYSNFAIQEFNKILAMNEGEKKKWLEQLRFQNTLRLYTGENLHYYRNGQDTVAYWLGETLRKGNNRFRLITTKDDFLNDEKALATEEIVPSWLKNSNHLIVLNDGSHISYLGWSLSYGSWFDRFFAAAFPKVL